MKSKLSQIELARIKLVMDHPFFSTIFMKREMVEDPNIKTACTDGVQIWYNNSFFQTLPVQEGTFVLAHEVCHIALMHHLRRGGRDPELWNYACDYAINPILVESGLTMPKNGLLNSRFTGMTAEAIYEILERERFKLPNNKIGIGQFIEPKSENGKPLTSEQVDELVSTIKSDVKEAALVASMRGKMPAGLDIPVKQIMRMGKDWKQILASFLTESVKTDYTFTHPNTRYISRGVYLPSLNTPKKGRFILAVDTSGSNLAMITQNKLTSEILNILSLSSDNLTVISCDAEVAHVQEIDPNSPEEVHFKGQGGTAFKPVLEWIEKNGVDPSALIYFTDLDLDKKDFPEEPAYPVIWATDQHELEGPYGETIYID